MYEREKKIKFSSRENLTFQALDWKGIDIDLNASSSDDDSSTDSFGKRKKRKLNLEYVVRIYGINKKGYSTVIHITGFTPFFFLKVPDFWTQKDAMKLSASLETNVYWKYKTDLIDCSLTTGKELYFFNKEKEFKFIKFSFKTIGAWHAYKKALRGDIYFGGEQVNFSKLSAGYGLYEANIDPILRLIHMRDLSAASWMRVPKKKWFPSSHTKCQIEGIAKWTDLFPVDSQDIAPMEILSFDIECVSEDGSFPDPERESDKVIQIGSTIHRNGEKEVYLRHIVTLKKCNDIEGAIVECCDTEVELLRKWCQFINRVQPDIMTGYNIWGFDWRFLWKRCELLKCSSYLTEMGKHKSVENKYEEKKLSSSALGDNSLYYMDIEGIVQIDLLKLVQRDFKLDSYKLDNVAKNFMNQEKDDLSPKQLFANFKDGSPEKITEIAKYCIQDNVLCNNLIIKLAVISNNIGMANVCSVPFTYLFTRGQSIKIFSLVAKQCRQEGIKIPTITKDDVNQDSYEGAIVFVPKPQICYEPVTVLDYASLYPSCMIAENISHDSIVVYYEYGMKYGGTSEKTIRIQKVNDFGGQYFKEIVLNPGENISRMDLLEIAKEKPKEFNTLEFIRGDLDLIGGNKKFMNMPGYFYNKITYDIQVYIDVDNPSKGKVKVGEKECYYIDHTRGKGKQGIMPRILVDMLNARRSTRSKITYQTLELKSGESISGNIQKCEVDGKKVPDISDGFYKVKTEFDGKKEISVSEVVSISDTYNTFMKDILDGLQLAYKVVCNSVYGQCGASISPICFKELAASTTAAGRGMVLLARDNVLENFPKAECVYGDSVTGRTRVLVKIDGKVKRVKIENLEYILDRLWTNCIEKGKQDKEFIPVYKEDRVFVWSDLGWTSIKNIIRHELAGHKSIYCVRTDDGYVEVTDEHSLLDSDGNVIKVSDIKIGMTKLLVHPYGNNKEDNLVRECYKIPYSGYVYDLTTENHHFQAGIGNIIVHNTDSVFINFTNYLRDKYDEWDTYEDSKKLKITIETGQAASKIVKKVIKNPHDLEYEKIFYPFVIFTKKRYFGNKYEFDPNKCKRTSMGIALKRRDYAPIVKEIYAGVIDIILNERDKTVIENKTKEYFVGKVRDLLDGAVPIRDLTITKSLRGNYSNPTQIAHKVLADRIGKRDPGNKPASNDRIPYCFISEKWISCYHCEKKITNIKECKCRGCCELFCYDHLNDHDCKQECRYCKVPRKKCNNCEEDKKGRRCECNVRECSRCLGWFCDEHLISHDYVMRKDGTVNPDKHKCINPINPKASQGDLIEIPSYIIENNVPLSYRYYLDHQIKEPILQIFSLMMDDPESLIRDMLIDDTNNTNGFKSINSYFTPVKKKKNFKDLSGSTTKSNIMGLLKGKKKIPIGNMNIASMLRDVKKKRKDIREKSKSPISSSEEKKKEVVVV